MSAGRDARPRPETGGERKTLRPFDEADVSLLLSSLCHEFRTPLNAILGFSQLLSLDEALSHEAKRRVDGIERAGNHLLRLVEDVLEMAVLESGESKVHRTSFEVEALLEDVKGMFEAEAKTKGLSLEFRCAPDAPACVITDPFKLRQILINLVSNAVKFTQAGGVLVLVLADEPADDSCLLHVEVMDTGPGIDEADRELVFQKFGRGRADHLGTGLGLAISHEHARLLGGALSFESTVGRGTVFRLTLPVTWVHFPASSALESEEILAPSSRERGLPQLDERGSGTFQASIPPPESFFLTLPGAQAKDLISAALAADQDEILAQCRGLQDVKFREEVERRALSYRYQDIVRLVQDLLAGGNEGP